MTYSKITILKDLNLTDFDFWSGAKQHEFTYTELESLQDCIAELYDSTDQNNPTETDINDLFWFEEEFLCDMIGLDFEEYENR